MTPGRVTWIHSEPIFTRASSWTTSTNWRDAKSYRGRARRCHRNRKPLVNFPEAVYSHSDEEHSEITLDLCCHSICDYLCHLCLSLASAGRPCLPLSPQSSATDLRSVRALAENRRQAISPEDHAEWEWRKAVARTVGRKSVWWTRAPVSRLAFA